MPYLTAAAKQPGSKPSFLFSNSGLWDQPIADFFCLSMQKAAQYNLALSLNQILAPQGVHVASVNIGGLINDEDAVLSTKNIAKNLFELYEQDRPDWKWEVEVGIWQEFLEMMAGQSKGLVE